MGRGSSRFIGTKLRTEAPVNGGRNYNGQAEWSNGGVFRMSESIIGKLLPGLLSAVAKSGYMLGTPSIRRYPDQSG